MRALIYYRASALTGKAEKRTFLSKATDMKLASSMAGIKSTSSD